MENKRMNYLLVKHKVKDFKKWKVVYDEHEPAREAARLKECYLLRNNKNRNEVFILFQASDLARANAFVGSAELRAAMKKRALQASPNSRCWPTEVKLPA